jgi:Leucine-rich repeat (LRR) protein
MLILPLNLDANGTLASEIGNLPELNTLQLNGLQGTIPSAVGTLTNLAYLDLSGVFVGSIPSVFGKLTNLKFLSVGGNLSGSIPNLSGSTGLTSLDISAHYSGVPDNRFTGGIPSWLFKMPNLEMFSGSGLTGTIPSSASSTSLRQIYIRQYDDKGSQSWLNGTLPRFSKSLTNLALDGNKLTGTIPSSLGEYEFLTQLFLSFNQFTGTIPSEMAQLHQLTNIDLRANKLTGLVPALPFAQYTPDNGGCSINGDCTEPDCNHFDCPLPATATGFPDCVWCK